MSVDDRGFLRRLTSQSDDVPHSICWDEEDL